MQQAVNWQRKWRRSGGSQLPLRSLGRCLQARSIACHRMLGWLVGRRHGILGRVQAYSCRRLAGIPPVCAGLAQLLTALHTRGQQLEQAPRRCSPEGKPRWRTRSRQRQPSTKAKLSAQTVRAGRLTSADSGRGSSTARASAAVPCPLTRADVLSPSEDL